MLEDSSTDTLDHQRDEHIWTLEQIKPVSSLEKKNDKTEVVTRSCLFQSSLEKTRMLGKIGDNRKRGKPYMRLIDSVKEATGSSIQELSRAIEDRTL